MHSAVPRSSLIKGLTWLGERIPYPDPGVKGDSYPMTWADDDEIYTSAGDPNWGCGAALWNGNTGLDPDGEAEKHAIQSGLDVEKFSGGPTDYRIAKVSTMKSYVGWGGDGPKPSGMICVEGVLYLAVQNMLRSRQPAYGIRSQHGSDAHIIYSLTKGGIWLPAFGNITAPMFRGHKFGGPSFVNFGRDNAHARDAYVYAVSSDQWDNGSNMRLGRVPVGEIVRREAWQWVCAFTSDGEPAWTYALEEAIPVLSLHRWLGMPEMVYLAGIKRYLLLTWRLHEDFSPDQGTDLLVLESPEPWGPFSLVHCEEYWEGQAFTPYCPRVPLKWMDADGLSGWMQFSGSWGPHGQTSGFYRSNVRPFRLEMR